MDFRTPCHIKNEAPACTGINKSNIYITPLKFTFGLHLGTQNPFKIEPKMPSNPSRYEVKNPTNFEVDFDRYLAPTWTPTWGSKGGPRTGPWESFSNLTYFSDDETWGPLFITPLWASRPSGIDFLSILDPCMKS